MRGKFLLWLFVSTAGCSVEKNDNLQPLRWEKNHPERKPWSKTVVSEIERNWIDLREAQDMARVCQDFYQMNESDQKRIWAELIVAMSYYESAWNPTDWMKEDLGIDPVTRRQVRSEGLLQLSYQDERNYGIDCGFDWDYDRTLGDNDPRKTIFDPNKNLSCGIRIMSILVRKNRKVFLRRPYWSVIRDGEPSKRNLVIRDVRATIPCS